METLITLCAAGVYGGPEVLPGRCRKSATAQRRRRRLPSCSLCSSWGTNWTGGHGKEDAGSRCSSWLAHCLCRSHSDPGQYSAIVAVLINTRGLTKLIALDLGLSVGLIDQRSLSILVLD